MKWCQICYVCSDTPLSLGVSALEAIPALTGTSKTGFDFTVYTGDLVSHDRENELSRSFVEYIEVRNSSGLLFMINGAFRCSSTYRLSYTTCLRRCSEVVLCMLHWETTILTTRK
jgi:hypothetical protein